MKNNNEPPTRLRRSKGKSEEREPVPTLTPLLKYSKTCCIIEYFRRNRRYTRPNTLQTPKDYRQR
ncbi:MAG TPA: hypothetical protein VE244_12265 [Nitrososphaeraceae archaeon]|nr:hypothetical protein [Nitrososphaeraceae archaeon]